MFFFSKLIQLTRLFKQEIQQQQQHTQYYSEIVRVLSRYSLIGACPGHVRLFIWLLFRFPSNSMLGCGAQHS